MHFKIMAALPCLTQTNTTKLFLFFFARIWINKCLTHKWSKLLSHNNCPRNVNCLIYVIVCAAVQRTSTVTSGTGITTSVWLAWNTMTWSTLWPSAQQTRSCCYLPATTPPLKCGARHAWCASPRHPSAPLGLANCSPPCLAAEVLIWMVNPDLDPGGRNARGKHHRRTLHEQRYMCEVQKLRISQWSLWEEQGCVHSCVALLQDVPWPTDSRKMRSNKRKWALWNSILVRDRWCTWKRRRRTLRGRVTSRAKNQGY